MDAEAIARVLTRAEALRTGHFISPFGKHSETSVDILALFRDSWGTNVLARELALRFSDIDVVVGTGVNGSVLAQLAAYHLSDVAGRLVSVCRAHRSPFGALTLRPEDARGIARKRALIVHDVSMTGATLHQLVAAVREKKGRVVGLGLVCNAMKLQPRHFRVQKIEALIGPPETWFPDTCPLCARGVPVDRGGNRK